MDWRQLLLTGAVVITIVAACLLLSKLLSLVHINSKIGKPSFRHFRYILPIFKKGWQIAYANRRLFWVLLGVLILRSLQQEIPHWIKIKSMHIHQAVIFPSLHSFLINWLRYHLPTTLQSAAFHLDITHIHLASIPVCLALMLSIKSAGRFISRQTGSEAHSSAIFLQKNLVPFVIVNMLILGLEIFYLARPDHAWIYSDPTLAIIIHSISAYWQMVIISLVTAIVFLYFKNSIAGIQSPRNQICASAVRFFKPLFSFNLWVNVIIFLISIAFYPSQWAPKWGQFLPYAFFWLLVLIIFVPYLIVIEDLDWQTGFRRNFQLWKKKTLRILTFLFLIVLFTGLLKSLLFPFSQFRTTWFSIPAEILRDSVGFAVSFWMTAVIMVFCSREIEKSERKIL